MGGLGEGVGTVQQEQNTRTGFDRAIRYKVK